MFYDNHSAGLKLEGGGHTETHTCKNTHRQHGSLTYSFFILNKESRLMREWHYIFYIFNSYPFTIYVGNKPEGFPGLTLSLQENICEWYLNINMITSFHILLAIYFIITAISHFTFSS
jgi:hypothetical protein